MKREICLDDQDQVGGLLKTVSEDKEQFPGLSLKRVCKTSIRNVIVISADKNYRFVVVNLLINVQTTMYYTLIHLISRQKSLVSK